MRLRTCAILAALGLLMSSAAQAAAESVALVIRNVEGIDRMASRDAVDGIADSLWQHGFDVVNTTPANNDRDTISRIVRAEFEKKLETADMGLLYYVGTATTGGDRSYVLSGATVRGVPSKSQIEISELLHMLGKSRSSVAIFDIVRRRPGGAAAGLQPGLGSIAPATQTQLLTYATTSDDRADAGLPLTASLSRYLKSEQRPLRLAKLATAVRDDVAYETGGRYVPWIAGNAPGDRERQRDADWKKRRGAALVSLLEAHKCLAGKVTQPQAVRNYLQRKGRAAPFDIADVASADTYDMQWLLRTSQPAACPEAFRALPPPSPPSSGSGSNSGNGGRPPGGGNSSPSAPKGTPSIGVSPL